MGITREDITGLVLAGGRGSRMGGLDKGLQHHLGMPLALNALLRLQLQVGAVLVSANRNRAAYERMGAPVWPDPVAGYPGPLGGLLAGLAHCTTPWLVSVPCDTPHFPPDLVQRLADAASATDAQVALACTRDADGCLHPQPVFALLQKALLGNLVAALQAGDRRLLSWLRRQRCVEVPFDDATAFFNANTAEELRLLQAPPA